MSKRRRGDLPKSVDFSENIRTASGTEIPMTYMDAFSNGPRSKVKTTYGKNAMEYNPALKSSNINTSSLPDNYFQSREERIDAQNKKLLERDLLIGPWNIKNVNDDGTANLCNIVTGVCMIVSIIATSVAANMGGKTRSKKRKSRKTRRRHK